MADESSRYVYRIHWSNRESGFVGTVAELPDVRYVAQSAVEALTGARSRSGAEVPVPFEDRSYSGHFMVRVPPEMHRRLVIEAAEQGVSLNRLVQSRLA